MKKLTKIFILLLSIGVVACGPIEDRDELGDPVPQSTLSFSISQEPGYDNKVFLASQTPGTITYWDYTVGSTTQPNDTIIVPFAGEYWVKYSALGRAGATSDSTKITVTENDPVFFAHPSWELLTGGVEGKSWKLFRVTLGAVINEGAYKSPWADVNWWGAEITNFDDINYFDLKGNYNFSRTHNGEVKNSTFTLFPESGEILINGGNQMSIKDGSGEMAEANKTKYKIFHLNADTLVVGQGAYYTADRPTEDWGFFHWYVNVK